MPINYNDSRFAAVNNEKAAAMQNVNNLYGNMINNSDKYYQDQINATKDYEKKQTELQQANTDFAIEKVNQQKEWAKQDYTKEQKASYTDWQKQSNQYGAEAERQATQGLLNAGYSESSQVSMYNQYQNRYATARQTYVRAITDYDNQIKEAQLANNSALAEIAYNSLQKQLELSLQGFQYKNTLLQNQLTAQNDVNDRYYARWKDVQDQINTENALAEQQRQFNEQMALQRQQFAWQKAQASASRIRSSSGKSSRSGSSSSKRSKKTGTGIKAGLGASNEAAAIVSLNNAINSTSKKKGLSKKTVAATMINDAYNKGKISPATVRSLSKQYGLK